MTKCFSALMIQFKTRSLLVVASRQEFVVKKKTHKNLDCILMLHVVAIRYK